MTISNPHLHTIANHSKRYATWSMKLIVFIFIMWLLELIVTNSSFAKNPNKVQIFIKNLNSVVASVSNIHSPCHWMYCNANSILYTINIYISLSCSTVSYDICSVGIFQHYYYDDLPQKYTLLDFISLCRNLCRRISVQQSCDNAQCCVTCRARAAQLER